MVTKKDWTKIGEMSEEEKEIARKIRREVLKDERYFKKGLTSGSDEGMLLILERTKEAILKHREEKKRKESGDDNNG
ncbi:MAG: hypothetical protein JJT94_17575 [Bernardetiaceae bacterium]|nr:hypothetical protein [Bernardetiaceae bacterium]